MFFVFLFLAVKTPVGKNFHGGEQQARDGKYSRSSGQFVHYDDVGGGGGGGGGGTGNIPVVYIILNVYTSAGFSN